MIAMLMCAGALTLHATMPCLHYAPEGIAAFADENTMLVELASQDDEDSAATLAEGLVVEVIRDDEGLSGAAGKSILIYHTHTYEAYEQDQERPYKQTEQWRTADNAYNVVAVGKALSSQLSALGFQVTQDMTAFEPPTLDDAYSRSLAMLETRKANGEQYDLYIDLHRDAIASTSTIKRTVNIGGEDVARFMVLVGKGTSGGYEEKPNWNANLAIAERITAALNDQCDGLARDVKVKTGRFNQHIADCCVLIECGTNWNTLDEVLAGVPYLAQAIFDAFTAP